MEGSGGYRDEQAGEGLPTSFVPGRNLLFLGVAGAYAVKLGCHDIVIGVSEADYSGYPDCREGFLEHMRKAEDEIKAIEDYVEYEGILGFFPAGDGT